MILKSQKKEAIAISILTIILGLIILIPFKIIETNLGFKNISYSEINVKLMVCPIIAIILSLYGMFTKYQQYNEKIYINKAISRLCYFPIVTFIITILGYSMGSLDSRRTFESPIGSLFLMIMLFLIVAFYMMFCVYSSWQERLSKKQSIIVDIPLIFFMIVINIIVYLLLDENGTLPEVINQKWMLLDICIFMVLVFANFLIIINDLFSNKKYSVYSIDYIKISKKEREKIEKEETLNFIISEFVEFRENLKREEK